MANEEGMARWWRRELVERELDHCDATLSPAVRADLLDKVRLIEDAFKRKYPQRSFFSVSYVIAKLLGRPWKLSVAKQLQNDALWDDLVGPVEP